LITHFTNIISFRDKLIKYYQYPPPAHTNIYLTIDEILDASLEDIIILGIIRYVLSLCLVIKDNIEYIHMCLRENDSGMLFLIYIMHIKIDSVEHFVQKDVIKDLLFKYGIFFAPPGILCSHRLFEEQRLIIEEALFGNNVKSARKI
jgi:hypothetical protein